MVQATLLPQIGTAPTVGRAFVMGSGPTPVNLQFNPQLNIGFSGTVLIEGSTAASPGANDWSELATVVFVAHLTNFAVTMYTDMPWMRARMTNAIQGAVSIYASSF